MTYTPTPWHQHDMEFGIICGPKGQGVADCKSPYISSESQSANAAFIVKAVNAHEALLQALKYASRFLNSKDHDIEMVSKAITLAEGCHE